MFWLSYLVGGRGHWHLMGRDWGCGRMFSATHSSPCSEDLTWTEVLAVLRLRNFFFFWRKE